ncbi:hypothetical protein GCM10009105_14040 [Dokdonella soli]|uniref:Uncharacterized protein n=1 Tax=Dokdonella soli TaxID=529810 RepID=A0ABN1IFF5_9GAMM
MRIVPALPLASLFVLAGCSGYTTRPAAKSAKPLAETAPMNYVRPCTQTPTTPSSAFDCDRRSILAMSGEFRVRFAFDETAALAPGYAPHNAQRSGGTELVEVIADTGDRISLQHILVLGKEHTVVKHWRQDWQYQPGQILRYRGKGRFEIQALAGSETHGAWSQTVYEVDDAPRYAGLGRWTHEAGEDSWESDRTLRPLPRREYTKRSDYQVLDVVNRHTLTPAGWVHEQDNTKRVLKSDGSGQALAREHGINSYTRIGDYDFGAGREYWARTATFWSAVRTVWDRRTAARPGFTTSPEPDGEPRIDEFFKLAERARKGEAVSENEISTILDRYVRPDAASGMALVTPAEGRAPRRSPSVPKRTRWSARHASSSRMNVVRSLGEIIRERSAPQSIRKRSSESAGARQRIARGHNGVDLAYRYLPRCGRPASLRSVPSSSHSHTGTLTPNARTSATAANKSVPPDKQAPDGRENGRTGHHRWPHARDVGRLPVRGQRRTQAYPVGRSLT